MPLRGEADQPTYLNLTPVKQGHNEVHTSYHAVLRRPVVQKQIAVNAVSTDSVVALEPQLLVTLNHPSIPTIVEAQFGPGRPGYVVMVLEHVGDMDGGPIVVGDEPPLSVGQTVNVGISLLGALDHLHAVAGMLHRDIKPDNIRLSSDRSRAWLIDFNLAVRTDADGTAQGALTPYPWMAPEVLTTGRYDTRSETFAFGVVLSELIRGRQMLTDQPNMEQVEARLQQGRRGFPDAHYRRWPAYVPDGLRRILHKANAADPDDRWQTAADMRTALGRLVYVDWAPCVDEPGVWEGTWPSTQPTTERIHVRVETTIVKAGPNRGDQRATVLYRPGTSWRRIAGIGDRTVDDGTALAKLFADIAKRLDNIRPAS